MGMGANEERYSLGQSGGLLKPKPPKSSVSGLLTYRLGAKTLKRKITWEGSSENRLETPS
jgi:hypothetical protein